MHDNELMRQGLKKKLKKRECKDLSVINKLITTCNHRRPDQPFHMSEICVPTPCPQTRNNVNFFYLIKVIDNEGQQGSLAFFTSHMKE